MPTRYIRQNTQFPHTDRKTHTMQPKGVIISVREVVRYFQWLPHTKRNAVHETSAAGRDVTRSNIMSSSSGAGDEEGGCFIHVMLHTQHTLT